MTGKRALIWIAAGVVVVLAIVLMGNALARAAVLSPKEQLGKSIFFDENLSINGNQSCASCHAPQVGWTNPDSGINARGAVHEGSFVDRFGERKPPSAAYATSSPLFGWQKRGRQFVGGNFWDGRATGEKLGNPAADQALNPFLGESEMAMPDPACVVYRVCAAPYPASFGEVWGAAACDIAWPADVETVCATEGTAVALSPADRARSDAAYDKIALSIAAFEASPEVNAFTSRYDYALEGLARLTPEERRGFALFQGKGQCASCHASSGKEPLFTDFTYHNLGVPQNPDNPAGTAPGFVDPGLGGALRQAGSPDEVYRAQWGKHKVPTLRNVDKRPHDGFVKAYGHNGYFKSLEEVVHFMNTRDVLPVCDPGDPGEKVTCWPPPEVPENVYGDGLGDLGLTLEEEAALVAFLRTLSDGFAP